MARALLEKDRETLDEKAWLPYNAIRTFMKI